MPLLTLGIGSNINPQENIRRAVKALATRFPGIRCSSVYESEAIGFDGDNFLNLVAVAESEDPLPMIMDYLKSLEDELGRDRTQPKFSGRTMDIDILSYGDNNGEEVGIELPRDEILKHAFVLRPLAELLPDTLHPAEKVSYAQLWSRFDQQSQTLWPVDFDWRDSLG